MFLSVRGAEAQPSYPFQDSTLTVEARLNDLVERMTLEEKIDLLAGYEDFYLHPCERLGIPAFKMADGPLGVSSWGIWGRATAFPAALALAASWDKELAEKTGIGRSTLYNYENGIFSPTIDALEKIADALGVQIEKLYEKEEKLYQNEKK